MRIRLVALALLAVGCRTGKDDPSNAKAFPPGAVGLPAPEMPLLASVQGPSGNAMFDALKLDAQNDSLGATKTYAGELSFFCSRSGSGGQIPNGAQGIVAPAQYGCSMVVPMHFPPGAQGLPAQPFLVLEGDAARDLYQAFTAQEKKVSASNWQKTFMGDGKIWCRFSSANTPSYACEVRGKSVTPPPPPPPPAGVYVTLTGSEAKTFYDLLKLQAQNAIGGGGKRRTGPTDVTCKKYFGGGTLPPGAQGIIAPTSYECTIRTVPTLPNGAQGLPAPAQLIATFKTMALGAKFYNGIKGQVSQGSNGAQQKNYNGSVMIDCGYAIVSGGQKKYNCEINSNYVTTSGIPPGAQGISAPQGGTSGIPPGAQGISAPHSP